MYGRDMMNSIEMPKAIPGTCSKLFTPFMNGMPQSVAEFYSNDSASLPQRKRILLRAKRTLYTNISYE